jgi:hypothetical protein
MTIAKLQPHRSMYLRGFDRRGAVASLNNASASGFTVSGAWADQADFAVLVLHDADDQYGHLFTSRYLPDFSLAGVTLDFDLALTNCQNPASQKFQSVPWGKLSYITSAEAAGTLLLTPTSITGRVEASRVFTVSGAPVAGDRIQLIYLGNIAFDVTYPTFGGSASVTYGYFNSFGTGYHHTVTIGANTYTYIQLVGDSSGAVAIGVAAAAAGDANATATASTNNVILTPTLNTGALVSCSASDGNGGATLLEITSAAAYMAGQLAAAVNGTSWGVILPTYDLAATAAGATVTVSAVGAGRDGNGIQLLTMNLTATAYLSPGGSAAANASGVAKLTGGVDPTSVHFTIPFTGALASLRQCWLTFAPALNYDSGIVNQALVPYVASEWSAVVTNWVVTDTGGVTPLKISGPGSFTAGSRDFWVKYSGTSWAENAGFYVGGYARVSAHAGDAVTVTYHCQHTHNLYLGTALTSSSGEWTVSLDGGAAVTVDTYADTGSPIAGRRLIAAGVAAGKHSVTLKISATKNALSAGFNCLFDFLQAAVLSDLIAPAVSYPDVNCACDYDTGQTYQLAPERALWILSQAGFAGDIDFYAGVFFALKRTRAGGNFHQATVTLSGTFGTGSGIGDGDAAFLDVGGTSFGAAAYPSDTLTTLAQRLVDCINATFVGVCAAPAGAGVLVITTLSPIDGFTLTQSATGGGAIAATGDIGVGNEGTWSVDAAQASPLNRGFVDYLADFAGLVKTAGQTMTVAFSQELLAPPDVNTAAGAWSQRFPDGTQVLTATGFGSWGAGVVDGVSGSGPQTIHQIGHGYITGNTVHIAQGASGAVWAVTVTDADHYQLTTLFSGVTFTVAAGAITLIDLQTTQCTFNPLTMTAYMSKCYVQAANLLNAAALIPWLQFGEVGWWFFSRMQNLLVGFASFAAPVSIGTSSPHGRATGEKVIAAGIRGDTAANGDWTIVVTNSTHFTLTGSNGNGAYVAGTGTVSGGGMAYYDAWAVSAAATALGRAMANFQHQDDDPTVNAGADAAWLAGAIKTHIDAIRTAVLAAQAGSKFELLFPLDVNFPSAYWTNALPYPQGGRMNAAVNFPPAYLTPAGSGLDRLKMEALSWGSTYRNLDNAVEAMRFPFIAGTWAAADVAYLVPWFNGGCGWEREYALAAGAGIGLINFWAVDHLTLLGWEVPVKTLAPGVGYI